jgi:hypothetical protein
MFLNNELGFIRRQVCLENCSKPSAQVFHRYRVIFSQHSEFSQPQIGLAFISRFSVVSRFLESSSRHASAIAQTKYEILHLNWLVAQRRDNLMDGVQRANTAKSCSTV